MNFNQDKPKSNTIFIRGEDFKAERENVLLGCLGRSSGFWWFYSVPGMSYSCKMMEEISEKLAELNADGEGVG